MLRLIPGRFSFAFAFASCLEVALIVTLTACGGTSPSTATDSGSSYSDSGVQVGPDGYIYVLAGNGLYKVIPDSGS